MFFHKSLIFSEFFFFVEIVSSIIWAVNLLCWYLTPMFRGADNSLARPGRKQAFLSEWREFPSAPCFVGKEKSLMTARVSMFLKSLASLTWFRACFLPGRAKDLSAPWYCNPY